MENRAFLRTTLLRSSARRSAAGQVAYRVVYSRQSYYVYLSLQPTSPSSRVLRSTEHCDSRDTVAHEQREADCLRLSVHMPAYVRLYIGAALSR